MSVSPTWSNALLPKTLLSRVYLLYGVTLAAFFSLTLVLFYQYAFNRDLSEQQENAATLAYLMAPTLSDSAVIGDFDTIKRLLEQAIRNSKFSEVSFIDLDGSEIKAVNRVSPESIAPSALQRYIAERLFDISLPVRAGGRDYGVLRMKFDSALVAESLWEMTEKVIGLGLIALCTGILFVGIPLKRWIGALNRVESYERDIETGKTELSTALDGPVPKELQATFEMITRTARNLRAQEEELKLFKTAFSQAPVGVVIADAEAFDYPVIFANNAFLEITQYSLEEILGQNCRILAGADTDSSASERIRLALIEGASITIELVNYTRQGGKFLNRLVLKPVFSSVGHIRYYIGYLTDITEENALHVRIERNKREYVRMLKERVFGKVVSSAIADLARPIGSLPAVQWDAELLASLREVALYQVAKEPSEVSVNEFIGTLIRTIRPTTNRMGCSLDYECSVESMVYVNAGALLLALQSLVLVSAEACCATIEHDRRIHVSVELKERYLVIRVLDNSLVYSTNSVEQVESHPDPYALGEGESALYAVTEITTKNLNGAITRIVNNAAGTGYALTIPTETVDDRI